MTPELLWELERYRRHELAVAQTRYVYVVAEVERLGRVIYQDDFSLDAQTDDVFDDPTRLTDLDTSKVTFRGGATVRVRAGGTACEGTLWAADSVLSCRAAAAPARRRVPARSRWRR